MSQKIYIGNFPKGLVQNPLPFNIDNNSFPTMQNFYTWRGRAKRKRGTRPLGRLQVQVKIPSSTRALVSSSTNLLAASITGITKATNAVVSVTGGLFKAGQMVYISGVVGMTEINGGPYTIIAASSSSLTLSVNSTAFTAYSSGGTVAYPSYYSIVPGSINITATTSGNVYTEPASLNGTLVGAPSGSGTINYATGAITLTGEDASYITGTFSYFPALPVMGLEDFLPVNAAMTETIASPYPLLLAFDTTYSYQNFTPSSLGTTSFFNTNYFKNPPSYPATPYTDGSTNYAAKGTQTGFTWTGQNYQQFWTTNFEQALWATNGTPGMQIQAIVTITWNSATNVTFAITNSPAVEGDFVFVNEITGTNNNTINGQTGYVSNVSGSNVTVVFPYASISNQSFSGGIIQYLTNVVPTTSSASMGDGIKWYDGDPTNNTGLPSSSAAGWVNFNPPLSAATNVTIDDYSSLTGPYYLVGCKSIMPYKDRILFFGPYIQTSADALLGNKPVYLQDSVIWSWNGTPYYTSSFAVTAPIVYSSILTPGTSITGVTAESSAVIAYYVDQPGLGGWLAAGLQQAIVSLGLNEDVIIVGFTGRQTRLVYTSNDLAPFLFYTINSELGASATFSGITLDRGVLSFGTYGFAMTDQTSSQRIDLEIPDLAFQIQSTNFGVQRINAARDFYREWIYFSYMPNNQPPTCLFPTQTFFYNYRESNWALFYENFTTHGSYWPSSGLTWATLPYLTWSSWTDPWNYGDDQALVPNVVGGNPQGFVVVKGLNTSEAPTGTIQNITSYTSSTPNTTQITSQNHCVQVNDYLYFTGAIGTTFVNGVIGQVTLVIDSNNFVVDIDWVSGTYGGLGVYTRLSVPFMQSKQFPAYWEGGRQVRIGTQQYLFDNTDDGQVTLNLYLSMDPTDAWNAATQPTDPNDPNNAVIYSQLVYTCPESTNIELTPANTNLQMPTAAGQYQIWHRMNTSLIGDTVQFGITLNDAQMRDLEVAISEIAFHAAVLDIYPGPLLS